MTHRALRLRLMGILAALALLSVSGCKEDGGLGPGTLVEVTNVVDLFRWQFTATEGVTQTLTYTWSTTGPMADVTQGGGVLTGTGSITVRDANGTEVYSRSLDEDGAFATAAGTPGDWIVTITLNDMTAVTSVRLEIP